MTLVDSVAYSAIMKEIKNEKLTARFSQILQQPQLLGMPPKADPIQMTGDSWL
jgi:hypothetical protein